MADSGNDLFETLRTHHLFSGLNEAEFDKLRSRVRLRNFSADQTLFTQGDAAADFFLLWRGSIKLYRISSAGQEKIMRLIQPGQTFAESVMFMDEPRYPVHAQALQSGALVTISAAAYLDVMRASFTTCCAVFQQLSERIQAHWDEIERLTLQNSRYRVVYYLLSLLPTEARSAADVDLPVRKSLVAAHLGITPETLSRILHDLEQNGLIQMHGYQIHIPNLAALHQYLDAGASPG